MNGVDYLVQLVACYYSVAIQVVQGEDPPESLVSGAASQDREANDKVSECDLLFALHIKRIEDKSRIAIGLGTSREELCIN